MPRIPTGHVICASREDAGLWNPKEESCRQKAMIIVNNAHESHHNTPADGDEGN